MFDVPDYLNRSGMKKNVPGMWKMYPVMRLLSSKKNGVQKDTAITNKTNA